jgi:hypothetical protein
MALIGKKLRGLEGGKVAFHCPGCDTLHPVVVDGPHAWTYNGDPDAPTFSPSVLVRFGGEPDSARCHSFVESGRIRFLSDCTHDLAGQTVDLPDLEGA